MKYVILLLLLFCVCLQGTSANEQEFTQQDVQESILPVETEQASQPEPFVQPLDNLEELLGDVEKHYGEIASTLRSLQRQIDNKRRNIDKIELDILTNQRAIAKVRKELCGHIKAAYQMGQQEQLKLLLNQQDPALSNRMMIYYSYINKARLAKIDLLEKSIQDLERLDKQRQSETELLEQDLKQKQLQQAALSEIRKQRNGLLADTAATSYEEQQRYLLESENKLRNLIANLPQEIGIKAEPATLNTVQPNGGNASDAKLFADLNGSFESLKGKLPWPVQGKLVKDFSHSPTEGSQNGILIEAKEGVDVRAVASGTLTFADWMRSYGYLVIIDHGDGYMSLYAFNQSLYKHVNDKVNAGDVIASVGQSGGRSRPGLFFGIRKKATPISPLLWCRNN